VDLQVFGEHRVADEIGDQAEGGGRDHHRHDGEAVEAVGEVHRVAAPTMTKRAEQMKNQPRLSISSVLEERDQASAVDEIGGLRDDAGGDAAITASISSASGRRSPCATAW
jgi:hypothetical protein